MECPGGVGGIASWLGQAEREMGEGRDQRLCIGLCPDEVQQRAATTAETRTLRLSAAEAPTVKGRPAAAAASAMVMLRGDARCNDIPPTHNPEIF